VFDEGENNKLVFRGQRMRQPSRRTVVSVCRTCSNICVLPILKHLIQIKFGMEAMSLDIPWHKQQEHTVFAKFCFERTPAVLEGSSLTYGNTSGKSIHPYVCICFVGNEVTCWPSDIFVSCLLVYDNSCVTELRRLSRNLGASNFWNPKGLSRPVKGLLYLF
jgi:hypothetical protein